MGQGHIKGLKEAQALEKLEQFMDIHNADHDALPGSAVDKVKQAIKILRKRKDQRWRDQVEGRNKTCS